MFLFVESRVGMMALLYRVTALGEPRGPWRCKKAQAERDALAQGLAEIDEWGTLYLDAVADIQWAREKEVRLSA